MMEMETFSLKLGFLRRFSRFYSCFLGNFVTSYYKLQATETLQATENL